MALDKWALVEEVGREGLSVPLQTYEEMLRGMGGDGSRVDTLTKGCPAVVPGDGRAAVRQPSTASDRNSPLYYGNTGTRI